MFVHGSSHVYSVCILKVFDKMSLWYFFTLLDSDEYQTFGLFMFPH